MLKSLSLALNAGMPTMPKAAIQMLSDWIGKEIRLTDGAFWKAWSGHRSFLGKPVTVDQSLQLATVWACVRLISETLATLPLGLWKTKPDGSAVQATDHNLYDILHDQPNAWMTAVSFWEAVLCSLCCWGNAYVEIFRTSTGIVTGLDFIHPSRVLRAERIAGAVVKYTIRSLDGKQREIFDVNMMHIRAFTVDGMMGVSPVEYGVNVLGTAIEADRSSAETFRDALRSPGLVLMDKSLTKPMREEIRDHVNEVSMDGGVMVLEKGAGFQKIGFDPVTAQLLESRKWNNEEICRWFRVDPALVGYGGKDSNWGTGLEQKMLWLITLTLRQWCVRIEKSIRRSLLTPVERIKYMPLFNLEGLLRGDSASRAAFYQIMVRNGLKTRDECRLKENDTPMGGNAAVLTVESNLIPLDKLGEQMNAAGGAGAADSQQAKDSMKAWLGLISIQARIDELSKETVS